MGLAELKTRRPDTLQEQLLFLAHRQTQKNFPAAIPMYDGSDYRRPSPGEDIQRQALPITSPVVIAPQYDSPDVDITHLVGAAFLLPGYGRNVDVAADMPSETYETERCDKLLNYLNGLALSGLIDVHPYRMPEIVHGAAEQAIVIHDKRRIA